jgi:hypothetical protein
MMQLVRFDPVISRTRPELCYQLGQPNQVHIEPYPSDPRVDYSDDSEWMMGEMRRPCHSMILLVLPTDLLSFRWT